MNRVNWMQLGGAPIANDDWDFQDAGLIAEFKKLVSFLGDNFIVSGGGVIGSGPVAYLPAVISLNGEMLQVPIEVIDIAITPHVYIEVDETDDPAGIRTLENGLPGSIWKVRKGRYVGYSTVQTGKVLVSSLKTAHAIISENVETFEHNFTKRQVFHQEVAYLYDGDNTIDDANISANVLYVAKSPLATPSLVPNIVGFASSTFNGTVYFVYFDCECIVKQSANLTTPGGLNYRFKPGDTALFCRINGVFRLFTDKSFDESWHSVVTGGEITPISPWSGTDLNFRKDGDFVSIIGLVSTNTYNNGSVHIFTLPVGYRPKNNLHINLKEMFSTNFYGSLNIAAATGNVYFQALDVTNGTACGAYLGSIVFSVK